MATTPVNATNIASSGLVKFDGTATFSGVTVTNHSLLAGAASNGITSLGVATNGQLPIGSTGADPVLATLTAGSGITITNGAGSITIAATGGSTQPQYTYLSTQTASASSTLSFTSGLDTTYRAYRFVILDLLPSTSQILEMRVSTNGGSSYDNSAVYATSFVPWPVSGTSPPIMSGTNNATEFQFNAASSSSLGYMWLDVFNVSTANNSFWVQFQTSGVTTFLSGKDFGMGIYKTRASVNAVQFFPSAGNFTSGSIALYGIS
jgi:hypothetical protein